MADANDFFTPGDQRAANVNALFATIARRYDRINDLQSLGLHRRWKRRVVDLARVRPGEIALDVCCGTGDIAMALAERGARVTGLDFSEEMLAVAKSRNSASRGTSTVNYLRGDAMKLPFPDAAFDVVSVGYGLRNLADWEIGLVEMVRVAKPGARLLVLDFGKPDDSVWRAIYLAYLRVCVPLFGLLVLPQCRRLRLHPRIPETFSRATRRGREDALSRSRRSSHPQHSWRRCRRG